jgi:hypothetical protein
MQCAEPGCPEKAAAGSNYCAKHKIEGLIKHQLKDEKPLKGSD